MLSKVGDEITCPFPNFNGVTVDVWERKQNSPHISWWLWLFIHAGINVDPGGSLLGDR